MNDERIYHDVARCRWCGGRFVQIHTFQWICEREECAQRQIAHAILKSEAVTFPSPYLYLPLPLQVDIEENQTRRLLVHGAAGISKSFGGRWSLYARCRKIPGYTALLLRCTYDQLFKNHLVFMDTEAKLLGDAKYEKGTPKRMVFENGSSILFGYCQDRADIGQHTGPEWDEVLIEEAVQMLPEAVQEITSRDRGASTSRPYRAAHGIKGRSRLLTNPGGRCALYLDDMFIKKDPDRKRFKKYNPVHYGAIAGDIRDNPFLDPDYEDASLGGLESDRWEQLARGRWDVFPGQFFESFDPAKHVVTDEPLQCNWACGLQWSYSARAWCGLFAAQSDGRVLLRHEITWLRVAPEDAVVDFKEKLASFGIGLPRDAEKRGLVPLRYVVAQDDLFPSEKRSIGETISETFARAGVPMRRADMDQINGWNRLRSWLRTREHEDRSVNPPRKFTGPSLLVHRDCEFFIRTFPTIVSDEKHPDLPVETTDMYPALGARNYVMSRPAPASKQPLAPPPRQSVYYDIAKIRRGNDPQRLGSDNVI